MIDCMFITHYVAGYIESFKTDCFVIWSGDDSGKSIIRCQVLVSFDTRCKKIFTSFVRNYDAQFSQLAWSQACFDGAR